MSPLDTPFDDLTFRLDDDGSRYLVGVRHLCSQPLFTPTPRADARELQAPDRIFGRRCAAVLQSFEACVLYVAGRSEGLLPESVRKMIRWEGMAKPHLV